MKVTDYSANKIKTLSTRAKRGDVKALNELQRLNVYIVNNITRREKTIKKQGVNSPALTRFKSQLKKVDIIKPSKSKKLNLDQLETQVLAGYKLLAKSKTGTAKGALQWEREEMARLAKRGIVLTVDEFRNEWKDFIESDLSKEYKEFDSERTLIEGYEAIKSGKTIEDLKKAWKEYTSSERSLPEAWNQFVTVPKDSPTPFSQP